MSQNPDDEEDNYELPPDHPTATVNVQGSELNEETYDKSTGGVEHKPRQKKLGQNEAETIELNAQSNTQDTEGTGESAAEEGIKSHIKVMK